MPIRGTTSRIKVTSAGVKHNFQFFALDTPQMNLPFFVPAVTISHLFTNTLSLPPISQAVFALSVLEMPSLIKQNFCSTATCKDNLVRYSQLNTVGHRDGHL